MDRRRASLLLPILAALAVTAACVDIKVKEGFLCSTKMHCPEPYSCFTVNGTPGCYLRDPNAGGASGAGGGRAGAGGRGGSGGADQPLGGACGSSADRKNCGACGHDCTALPNVNPTASGIECRSGVCYVPASACLTNYGHCSSRADDGCETSLVDANTCGNCTTKCGAAAPKCAAGSSGPQCVATCPTSMPNTCNTTCANLMSDPLNCGSCGHDCTALQNVAPGATGITCQSGVCSVPASACAAGYAHCSTRGDDGCETSLKTQANCGACGKTCAAPTALCSASGSTYACSSSCVAPAPDACDTKCVSLSSDPTNCGACNHDCTVLPNVRIGATGIECRSGACYVPPSACLSGWAHCSSRADDGCETVLNTSAHCGSCSFSCSGSTPICSLQTPPVCLPSCSGSTPTLCGSQCVNLMTDVKNCDACTYNCASLPSVKTTATSPAIQCVSGVCVIQPAACVSGHGHCSSNPADGCETDLTTPQTCGSCTKACAEPLGLCSTTSGTPTCSSSCTSPTPDLCTSKCVDSKADPTNCGSCGHDCTALPHIRSGAPVTCNGSGGCLVPQSACTIGFANCSTGAVDTDGCESALNTNANCGGCGIPCSLPHATTTCETGTCAVVSCSTGFGDCTSDPGCESPLNTPSHCGSCTKACAAVPNGTATCDGTNCGVSCPTGTLTCNAGANFCEPTAWTFESSINGWTSPSASSRADNGTLTLSTAQAHGGTRSLSAQVSFSSSQFDYHLDHFPCGYPPFSLTTSPSMDLRGRTFGFWIYLKPDTVGVPSTGHLCTPYANSGITCIGSCAGTPVAVTTGQWNHVTMDLGSDAGAVTQLGFDCRPVTSPAWTGTVYIDDATIQ